jgi:hypothetical protein
VSFRRAISTAFTVARRQRASPNRFLRLHRCDTRRFCLSSPSVPARRSGGVRGQALDSRRWLYGRQVRAIPQASAVPPQGLANRRQINDLFVSCRAERGNDAQYVLGVPYSPCRHAAGSFLAALSLRARGQGTRASCATRQRYARAGARPSSGFGRRQEVKRLSSARLGSTSRQMVAQVRLALAGIPRKPSLVHRAPFRQPAVGYSVSYSSPLAPVQSTSHRFFMSGTPRAAGAGTVERIRPA